MQETKIQFIVPEGMFGSYHGESALVSILREIAKAFGDQNEWCEKYGTTFENEFFSMHRYCWCEKEECNWCGEKHFPNFEYKPTGFKVWWYKYIGRGMETNQELNNLELYKIADACLNSKTEAASKLQSDAAEQVEMGL